MEERDIVRNLNELDVLVEVAEKRRSQAEVLTSSSPNP